MPDDFCQKSRYALQVVRCFEDENVIHVAGKVDPVEDTDVINFELALADITQIEKRLERIAKGRAKTKEETASNEVICYSTQITSFLLDWSMLAGAHRKGPRQDEGEDRIQ